MPCQLIQRQAGLRESDPEQLLALSNEAGWNQTADDWRLLLACAGTNGLSLWQGKQRPIASALAIAYGGRFAWICMVLVTSAWRGQGIATYLLRSLIERLTQQGLIAGLDATVAGRAVYRPLGFNDIYAISRLLAPASASGWPLRDLSWHTKPAEGIVIEPLNGADLDALAVWDAAVFGANRCMILKALHRRLPPSALIARTASGKIAGYILARDGFTATHLGPIVAVDDAVAKSLLVAALAGLPKSGSVLIDALDQHPSWLDFLFTLGFVKQRGFSRMLCDRNQPLDTSSTVFAIAGPEFG